MSTLIIRAAETGDLPALHALWYATEVEGETEPLPAAGDVLPGLAHVLATGDLLLAERDGRVAGFAGLITRGGVAFLTDLFVRPDVQSEGVGRALLARILPRDGRILATSASNDPRAPALYIRSGMRPRWPLFWLLGATAALKALPTSGVALREADPADPELLAWDGALCGRPRAVDLACLWSGFDALPLWFERDGQRLGYGYIQRRSPEALWHPTAYTLGPIGAYTAEDAEACVLSAAAWARERAEVLRVVVPGPHPVLPALLEAGLPIAGIETFLCGGEAPFVDGRRYLPSGGTLF